MKVGYKGDGDPEQADGPEGEQEHQHGGSRPVRPVARAPARLQAALLHPKLGQLPLSVRAEGGRPPLDHHRAAGGQPADEKKVPTSILFN